ncbi:MAG TPA: NfeD family protein [Acidimicrobiales bacterium]|nr:NfeD family protein [Acidimicrobiales bacterium]
MAWVVGSLLVVLALIGSLSGAHAGGHGLWGPAVGVALLAGWLAAAANDSGSALAWTLAGTCATVFAASAALAVTALRARHQPSAVGSGLVGAEGRVVTELAPHGVVQVRGERWSAESLSGVLPEGTVVRVVSRDGVRLRVWSEEGQ